jgi:hypothetical protein
MPDATLLLVPALIFLVVRLLGFYSCEPQRGTQSDQTHLTLIAESGDIPFAILTNVSFFYLGPNPGGEPSGPASITGQSESNVQAVVNFPASTALYGQWTINVEIEFNPPGAPEGPTPFTKSVSGTFTPTWEVGGPDPHWTFALTNDDTGTGGYTIKQIS